MCFETKYTKDQLQSAPWDTPVVGIVELEVDLTQE